MRSKGQDPVVGEGSTWLGRGVYVGGSGQGQGRAGEHAPRYDPGWRLGPGGLGVLRQAGCWPPPALGRFSEKALSPQKQPRNQQGLWRDRARRRHEGGQWAASGKPVHGWVVWTHCDLWTHLGWQCPCDLVRPFTGPNVTRDLEGGDSPQSESPPLSSSPW